MGASNFIRFFATVRLYTLSARGVVKQASEYISLTPRRTNTLRLDSLHYIMSSAAMLDPEKQTIAEKGGAQFEEVHHEEHSDDIPPELEVLLHTKPSTGLTSQEVADRILKFGKNELPERKKNPLLKLLSFFTGAIAYLIEIACIIAAIGKFFN